MSDSQPPHNTRSRWRRRSSGLLVALAAVAFAASLAAIAFASGSGVTLTSAGNTKLAETITVDAQGRTLYVLSPETSHHLLCKSAECISVWPPLTVRSGAALKASAAVHGHLAILRRSNGALQVTLNGLPLYHFAGDRSRGEANGQHIHSFGGIWHVLSLGGGASSPPTAPSTPTATVPATPGYGY